MTAAYEIVKRVEALGTERMFSIADLGLPYDWWENIRVKLSRMVKEHKLVKVTKGRYYRPAISILGPVPPSTQELVRDILYDNGEVKGYLTGYSIWDSMGLTTQFSSTIIIGLNKRKDPIIRDGRKIRFVIQPNEINETNIRLLQVLDSLKYIKDIPDTTIKRSLDRLRDIVSGFDKEELQMTIKLSMKYPPRVRALLGALIDGIGYQDLIEQLRHTLNPLTTFRIGISSSDLSTVKNWNII